MFLGILDFGPAKYILKNASLSTDWLTPIFTSLAGEHAQCLSALLHSCTVCTWVCMYACTGNRKYDPYTCIHTVCLQIQRKLDNDGFCEPSCDPRTPSARYLILFTLILEKPMCITLPNHVSWHALFSAKTYN